jgi:DNA-binding Xre family transcriptional regulator
MSSVKGNRKGAGPANRFSQLLNAELRAEVARQRLSLRMLEDMTGISKARLSTTINQDASPLNTNEVDLICEALRLSPTDIFLKASTAHEKEKGL